MTPVSASVDEILALEREWCARLKSRDIDWIVNLFHPEGLQLPPGGEAVKGAAALRAAWQALANTEGLEIDWEPAAARVSAAGDMAYDYGAATIRTPDGRRQPAKYAVVWVRRDGAWKVALDIFNANA